MEVDAEEIFKITATDVKVNHITTAEYLTIVKRRINIMLSKKSLIKNEFNKLSKFKDALERFFINLEL